MVQPFQGGEKGHQTQGSGTYGFFCFNRLTNTREEGQEGKLINRLWVNRKGFHSNNVESLFIQVKKWARKRNGTLPRIAIFRLYLSTYMFRHNFPSCGWADRHIQALKLLACDFPEVDM